MTVVKLKYTIEHFEDGTACFNATNNDTVKNSEKTNTIEISNNSGDKLLEPIQLGMSLQNITSLLVPHCRLTYLPNELYFCNLIVLDISHNHFEQIPDFVIFHNTNLQKLDISHNFITEFNLEPKCYKKLKHLNLGRNMIHDFPQWIFNSPCTALETLDFSNNPLDKTSLLSGRSLIKLYSLNLTNSNMKNYLIFIQEIPYLKKLFVSNTNGARDYLNTVQELPFKVFASVSTLVELHFSGLGYSYLSEDICELSGLEILNISYNHLSWLPNNFSNLKSLQILNLSNNDLLSLPSDIHELYNLTELDISYNLIGSLPESFTNLNKLKLLDCYSNDLIEDALIVVNKLSSLVAFDIEQNSFSTRDDQHYLEMRNNIWKDHKNRMSGCKLVDISEDEDDKSCCSSFDDHIDLDPEVNEVCSNVHKEENWDCDSDSIGDDSLLVLPPYRFKINKKPTPYDPTAHINPIYFEDALEDDT